MAMTLSKEPKAFAKTQEQDDALDKVILEKQKLTMPEAGFSFSLYDKHFEQASSDLKVR